MSIGYAYNCGCTFCEDPEFSRLCAVHKDIKKWPPPKETRDTPPESEAEK